MEKSHRRKKEKNKKKYRVVLNSFNKRGGEKTDKREVSAKT